MRILHLCHPVGGNSLGLAQGEKSLGHQADVIVDSQSHFNYGYDEVLQTGNESLLGRYWKRLKKARQIRNEYEVLHFNFGSSLIDTRLSWARNLDLMFYNRQIKVVTYNGCDARQKFPTMRRRKIAACHNPKCYNGRCNDGRLDHWRQQGIKKISQYCDHIFAVNPDLLHFLPPDKSSFLPYSMSTFPTLETKEFSSSNSPLRVGHAPSQREAKGTNIIMAAIDSLKAQWPGKVELVLIENMTNQEALKQISQLDLLVDQLLIGWYGGVAIEALKQGVPVACYIEPSDLNFIPYDMRADLDRAIINVNPENIKQVLANFVEDQGKLRDFYIGGLDFVNKWHDPQKVAKMTTDKYLEIAKLKKSGTTVQN